MLEAIRALQPAGQNLQASALRALPRAATAVRRLGAIGRPLPPPPEEARPWGRRHSAQRDAQVIGHHYDVGNAFYELVLGPSMTYSCARFADPKMSLAEAQASKHDLMHRYVFPDGELIDVGQTVMAMQNAGFEVRDVESLREHFALTLRQRVTNLEENWDAAAALVGIRRARIWRLYMAGSAVGFEDGGLGVHQVLGTVARADGCSGMDLTRDGWATV